MSTIEKADLGLIGLAVMGENLVLNMETQGFKVAVFNRSPEKVDQLLAGRGKNRNIIGTYSLSELGANLKKPRKVMMMVKAGQHTETYQACGAAWYVLCGGGSLWR